MDIKQRLQQIRENYARDLPGQVASVSSNWQQLLANPANTAAMDDLYQVCHKLAGTGASFGYAMLSEHTRNIERILLDAIQQHKTLGPDAVQRLSKLVGQLPGDISQPDS